MQWTDRIRQVKIVLVIVAVVIAVASLLVSHFLVRDLSNEERHRMEVWAQALRSLNEADETTDLSLVLSVMEGNNTIPVVVLNEEGGIDDYRNIEDTVNISKYAQRMMKAGDTIRVGSQLVCYDESVMLPLPAEPVGHVAIRQTTVGRHEGPQDRPFASRRPQLASQAGRFPERLFH